jgi:hypothetical protein
MTASTVPAARVLLPRAFRCPITDRHFRPMSRRNARMGWRAACRSAAAMLTYPARRKMVMTRFLSVAMTCRPVPVRAVEASSPKATSRTSSRGQNQYR